MKTAPLTTEDVLRDLVVAIDGPAGSGKSTTARRVASALGFRHIDTGAMYRAVALKALRAGLDPEDGEACGAASEATRIEFRESPGGQTVLADGEDVTRDIRTPEVTRAVSPVSAHPSVRSAMVRQQRVLAGEGGAVLEGRDIGTVVLPSAEVKIYLVASARVRAERRLKELRSQGVETTVEEVEADIIRRDEYDSGREASPLRRAVGSILVDTSGLTIDEQVGRVVSATHDTATRLAALEPVRGSDVSGPFSPLYHFGRVLSQVISRVFFGLKYDTATNVTYNEHYIYACNHKSNVDPPFVGSCIHHEIHFMAKSTLFRNRVLGGIIRAGNAIPLKRGVFDREAMNQVLELLRENRSLMIFPEGGRVFTDDLGRARSGVGYLAVNSETAVIPMFVSGTNRLWRCLFRRERLHVSIGRPIRLAPGTAGEFADGDGYRAFAEMVLEAIRALKDEYESRPDTVKG